MHRRTFFFCFVLFFLGHLGTAQRGAPADIGYLEGRILSLQSRSPADPSASRTARVALKGGQVVDATLPQPLPGNPPDSMPDFRVGDRVELYFSPGPGGSRQYVVSDWVRRGALLWLAGILLLVAALVGRGKGLRAVLATGLSLAIVVGFVVPAILAGHSPILVSLVGVGGILILAVYFVHGLSWSTTAALFGTLAAVLVTMLFGVVFTEVAHLTGFGSEEAMFIQADASQVNLKGLLLAGLLVGALGALTDVTIVQASLVREFAYVDPSLGLWELYGRGMRVGRDHIGSLVNTLVLAYTGAALPLLILLTLNDFGLARSFNIELVASEVVHTLVGSIGLILAVPVTTLVAALLFQGDRLPMREGELTLGHGHGAADQAAARLWQKKRQAEVLASLTPDQASEVLLRRYERGVRGAGRSPTKDRE